MCLLSWNKHLVNNQYGLTSYSCSEEFWTSKEFKALTKFLLFYCLQASSFILNNCFYHLCLKVVFCCYVQNWEKWRIKCVLIDLSNWEWNLRAMVCWVFGGRHPARMGRNWEIQKSELLEQNFCLQPPEQRKRLTKIKKPYESVVEHGNYVGCYCDCNISKLQLMKCQPIVIMFYGSRSTESCD